MGALTRCSCFTKASRSSGARRIAPAVSALVLGTLALAGPASAATTTVTFNYTGAAQTWTVPAGVTEATFDLYGAQGGGSSQPAFAPGLGGRATATITVTPGASIQVNVGGRGMVSSTGTGGAGGFNGGGDGATGAGVGDGGGGASDIRLGGTEPANRVLVAGGGGGDGSTICGSSSNSAAGGAGGGSFGGDGGGCSATVVGGGGGTQNTGGSATSPATNGDFGVGGNGGGAATPNGLAGGGGGGGGWWGGGGGLGGGGGGGSGHGPAGTVFATGVRSGDGLVTVTYRLTIDTLIGLVQELALPTGITTSLLTKLHTAEDNLDAGNTAGACNQLGAFITQVKRQSGNKIPTAGADQLISMADEVRTSLNCGAALTCGGRRATIVGTGGSDKLEGTVGDDVIAAGRGDDTLVGLAGDDLVCGGGGADELRGHGGDDTLRGGSGKDELRGGSGSNRCRSGKGSDTKHRC
jgi:Glycine rich protein/RTX calcium-binding nonapeptide repeat (4 copies)